MFVIRSKYSGRPRIGGEIAKSARNAAYPDMWQSLRGLWQPISGNTGELVNDLSGFGNYGTFDTMPWGMSRHGPVITGTDIANQHVSLKRQIVIATGVPFSVWVMFKRTGANDGIFLSEDGNTTYGLYYTTTAMFVRTSGSQETLSHANSADVWNQMVITRTGAGSVGYWLNGDPVGGDTGLIGTLTIDNLINHGAASFAINGKFGAAGLWSRILTKKQIRRLLRDPHAITRPIVTRYRTSVASAGGARGGPLGGALVGSLGGAI